MNMNDSARLKKTAIVFPGQGAQHPGMGQALYDSFPIVREMFEEASDTLGIDMKTLCFEGPSGVLTRTDNAQPALVLVGVAGFRVFMTEQDILPAFLAGHSLGEITALACAGVLDFNSALRIARKRGELMNNVHITTPGPGKMLAILGIHPEKVKEIISQVPGEKGVIALANDNMETQTVISGHQPAVDYAGKLCEQQGASLKAIKVSAPFHCSLMEPAAWAMKEELTKYTFQPFRIPVIANLTAMPYSNHHEVPYFLFKQITSPVLWRQTLDFLYRTAVKEQIEMPPNNLLTKFTQRSSIPVTARQASQSGSRLLYALQKNASSFKENF